MIARVRGCASAQPEPGGSAPSRQPTNSVGGPGACWGGGGARGGRQRKGVGFARRHDREATRCRTRRSRLRPPPLLDRSVQVAPGTREASRPGTVRSDRSERATRRRHDQFPSGRRGHGLPTTSAALDAVAARPAEGLEEGLRLHGVPQRGRDLRTRRGSGLGRPQPASDPRDDVRDRPPAPGLGRPSVPAPTARRCLPRGPSVSGRATCSTRATCAERGPADGPAR
jgi:hypothetical protein